MDFPRPRSSVLESALAALLRPLCRVLLRQSMSFLAFEEIAKRVYVDVAMTEFGIEGKQPSVSRAAILSGLTRKEVSRLLSEPSTVSGGEGERYNRAARVLTGWLRDPAFADAGGQPRALADEGDEGFAGLVRRHGGDVPVRAVLDELLRVGAVQRDAAGHIELRSRAYVPAASTDDKLAILGTDVGDLISTIDHNLAPRTSGPRFQRKVMYHRIPGSALPGFRKLSAMQSQALLERLDRWLQEHDTGIDDEAPGLPGEPPLARVGVGVYYFEEPAGPSASTGEQP
jgi:hypothetical protein